MTYIENYICFVSTVVLLQEWLYLSTNLCSSEDVLNEISLKASSFSRDTFRNRSKKKLSSALDSHFAYRPGPLLARLS